MNCNSLENKNSQLLTGFYAKSNIKRQHFEKIKVVRIIIPEFSYLNFITQKKLLVYFVPYHLMQFQKLQHVVAHIQIVGKLSAKSKQ